VVDVYEVSNDSNRTLVSGPSGATWQVSLPGEATNPSSTGGDLPGESFRFVNGRAELQVPFPPGSRQLVLTYSIPVESSVPMSVGDPVATLEVLLEGTGSEVSGAGLVAEEPVSMDGRTFQRYRASNVAAGSSFAVELSRCACSPLGWVLPGFESSTWPIPANLGACFGVDAFEQLIVNRAADRKGATGHCVVRQQHADSSGQLADKLPFLFRFHGEVLARREIAGDIATAATTGKAACLVSRLVGKLLVGGFWP
jgi:hypothetical protein